MEAIIAAANSSTQTEIKISDYATLYLPRELR